MIELKARCTGNAQGTGGHHTATLVSENGLITFSLPSENLTFIPGNTYKVSIDGDFVKSVSKPAAKYAGPERRKTYTAIAPPMKERRATPWNYPPVNQQKPVEDNAKSSAAQ